MTPSEKFVYDLCEKSFFPFWSFPNPIGKKNKELCDVLLVCENVIVIVSVKDISISTHNDEMVRYNRWMKKAIHDSVGQIYGAEKYIQSKESVLLKDRKTTIPLPPKESRIIYRIAIAFGSNPDYPIPTGDFGKDFIHVFDEKSTSTILDELDTFTDFINYLTAKEVFISNKRVMATNEVDFLALYLETGLEFEENPDTIVVDNGLWDDYVKSDEYKEWRQEIEVSYIWDFMIHQLYKHHIENDSSDIEREDIEEAIRIINLEPRINRIELGLMLEDATKQKVKARMLKPLEGMNHSYVFIPLNEGNWEDKEQELTMRCHVARVDCNAQKVIGVAIGSNQNGSCFDIVYLDMPEINQKDIDLAKSIKKEFGYFKNPVISRSSEKRQ